jgi:hypothetical protein
MKGVEIARWLDSELLRPFTAVKDLYLGELCDRHAISILRELRRYTWKGEIELLPVLQRIFLRRYQKAGSVGQEMELLITMWQLSGRPVAIHYWDTPGEEDLLLINFNSNYSISCPRHEVRFPC